MSEQFIQLAKNRNGDSATFDELIGDTFKTKTITVAELPAAGVFGRMVVTTDGGPGGVPATMIDTGVDWAVMWYNA